MGTRRQVVFPQLNSEIRAFRVGVLDSIHDRESLASVLSAAECPKEWVLAYVNGRIQGEKLNVGPYIPDNLIHAEAVGKGWQPNHAKLWEDLPGA